MEWKRIIDFLAQNVKDLSEETYIILKELKKFSNQSHVNDVKTEYSILLQIIEILKNDVEILFDYITKYLILPEDLELTVVKENLKHLSSDDQYIKRSDYWNYILNNIRNELYELECLILEYIHII